MISATPNVECTGSVRLSIVEPDGSVGGFDATESFPVIVAMGMFSDSEDAAERTVEIGAWETDALVVRVDGVVIPFEQAMSYATAGLGRILRDVVTRHRDAE